MREGTKRMDTDSEKKERDEESQEIDADDEMDKMEDREWNEKKKGERKDMKVGGQKGGLKGEDKDHGWEAKTGAERKEESNRC